MLNKRNINIRIEILSNIVERLEPTNNLVKSKIILLKIKILIIKNSRIPIY